MKKSFLHIIFLISFIWVSFISVYATYSNFIEENIFSRHFKHYMTETYGEQVLNEKRMYFLVLAGYSCPHVVRKLYKTITEKPVPGNWLVIVSGIDSTIAPSSNIIIDHNGSIANSKMALISPTLINRNSEGNYVKHAITLDNMDSVCTLLSSNSK